MSGVKRTNSIGRLRTRPAGFTIPVPKQESIKNMRVWSPDELTREFGRAKRIGSVKVRGVKLLSFCKNAHEFHRQYYKDMQPFFVELWREIENLELPEIHNSKTQACQIIGCSMRWAQKIVAGTAEDSNKGKARKREAPFEVNSPDLELPTGMAEDIAIECLDWLFRKLRPLRLHHDPRYQETLRIMWPHIKEASEMKNPGDKTACDAVAD